jgi:hypothetical protein
VFVVQKATVLDLRMRMRDFLRDNGCIDSDFCVKDAALHAIIMELWGATHKEMTTREFVFFVIEAMKEYGGGYDYSLKWDAII